MMLFMRPVHKPIVLIVLDGWGYRESTPDNAIAAAHTPTWDGLWQTYPHTLLSTSGHDVGLPLSQMGNSEVGHLILGAGRIVLQDFEQINHAIETGDFEHNPTLLHAFNHLKKHDAALHIMGLLSPGGVHSHEQHFYALLRLAQQHKLNKVIIHAFLDGRDTPPQSALTSLQALDQYCQTQQCGRIASITGRYYAMDRDKRWDRTEKTYRLIVTGQAAFTANTPLEALQQAYDRSETDEFVQPTRIGNSGPLADNDCVLFMNFRADRARQLTYALTDPTFNAFSRTPFRHSYVVTLTAYASDIDAHVVFSKNEIINGLGEVISRHGLKQLRIAETEKYAHVTYFFNGGIESPYPGEDRLLIPSPKVATYNLQPEMSAPTLTQSLVKAIQSNTYDFIVCNFANADMVGHTGDFKATVTAIETIDQCLHPIIEALKVMGGEAIITADHGNAEKMVDEIHHQPHTAHTLQPVPWIYCGRPVKHLKEKAMLYDVAPTVLSLLGLPIPAEMTGKPIVMLT